MLQFKFIKDEDLLDWVKPKEVEFKSNRYTIDGTEAAVLSIADYPLRVKNAWGADLFNIPNTKVVMHIKPVDKYKAIKRIDASVRELPPTALETYEQLVSQVVVVDARPFTSFTTEGYTTFRPSLSGAE